MALGLPVLILAGTVRRVIHENIPPRTSPDGGSTSPAYTLTTATIDTGLSGVDDEGGLAEVTIRSDRFSGVGETLGNGEVVTVKARPYVAWVGPEGRRRAVVRFAWTGPAEPSSGEGRRRPSAVPAN